MISKGLLCNIFKIRLFFVNVFKNTDMVNKLFFVNTKLNKKNCQNKFFSQKMII